MKYTFLLWWVVPLSALAQPPACDALQVQAVWLDPFDTTQARVLATNPSSADFPYPTWTMRDFDGTVWAQEEAFFFGIPGISVNSLVISPDLPLDGDYPAVLDLYTDLGAVLTCSKDIIWTPRSFTYSGTGEGGCLPVRVRISAFASDVPVEVAWWIVEEGETEPVAEGNALMYAEGGWTDWGESFCLDQNRCYTLHFASEVSNIEFAYALADPVLLDYLVHWISFGYADPGVPVTNTYAIDLYGGDCPAVGVQEATAPEVALYPNPGSADGFTLRGAATDRVVVFDAAGRRLHDAPLSTGRIAATDWSPGLYHVLRCVDGTCGAARWIKR